jgi:hypothetical protein
MTTTVRIVLMLRTGMVVICSFEALAKERYKGIVKNDINHGPLFDSENKMTMA